MERNGTKSGLKVILIMIMPYTFNVLYNPKTGVNPDKNWTNLDQNYIRTGLELDKNWVKSWPKLD